MKYYLHVIKNYAVFTGRARRSEYWYFILFNIIFALAAAMLDAAFGLRFNMHTYDDRDIPMLYGYIYVLYALFVFIPGLAVLVRRLHDVGKSGWFALILLIPLIGAIWVLVLLCTDSVVGDNKYGPNPKDIGNNDDISQIGNYLEK